MRATVALPNGTTRRRRARLRSALDAAYAEVDRRDGGRCQVTGVWLRSDTEDPWQVLTRDHLGCRNTYPEDRRHPDAILTVSLAVHRLLQASKLLPVDRTGEDTRRVSQIAGYVWNRRLVPEGKEPFPLPNGKAWTGCPEIS